MGVKSRDEAVALPEIDRLAFLESAWFDSTGIAGDDIIMFVDDDGVSKEVVETKEGLRKVRMRQF